MVTAEATTIEDLELKNKFKKFLINSTKLFAKQYNTKVEVSTLSEKAQKITELMNDMDRDFGCGRKNVADIISLVIGEPVVIVQEEGYVQRRAGACVVLLEKSQDHGHNYKLGEPLVYYGEAEYLLKMSGSIGNNPGAKKQYMRPATEDEIETFVEKVPIVKVKFHFPYIEAMA